MCGFPKVHFRCMRYTESGRYNSGYKIRKEAYRILKCKLVKPISKLCDKFLLIGFFLIICKFFLSV